MATSLIFLIPLVLGFTCNLASAFTTFYSWQYGERRGTLLSAVLRNILGIPVWAAGFALAARTPARPLFVSTLLLRVIAWSIIAAGMGVILAALVTIRFRSALPSRRDGLAQEGIYAHIRHPIHTGTLLEFSGLFLLLPTWPVMTACLCGLCWLVLQSRFEEYDLLQRLPDYRDYIERVPRFAPRLRRSK